MSFADTDQMCSLPAAAKVNLWLDVLAREESGYHQLESLFCALELADTVCVRAAEPGIELLVGGGDLGPPHRNLAHRAATLFHEAIGQKPAVSIQLDKRIPAGAGLGGGSSDAAATLRALNQLHGHPLDRPALFRLGATIGSDVPFFLGRSPLALAWGRGERLLELPALPPAPALVVVPPFRIDTPAAYRLLDDARGRSRRAYPAPPPLRLDALASWAAIGAAARNDFEPVIFAQHPRLGQALERLAATTPVLARLTGSGAALFALFADDAARDRAAAEFAADYPDFAVIGTRTMPDRSDPPRVR